MPARSNDFQKLIYLIKHNLADGATVTESRMLIDLVAGDEVEVDVCVEGFVGGDLIKVCVECRDRSRRADKNWIHEMKAKHERLPTNALVLASSRGFSKRALELARSYGIQTVTLEDVEDERFPAMLANEMSLWAKTVSVSAKRVVFHVEASGDLPEEAVTVAPNQLIYDSGGAQVLTAMTLVSILINAPVAREFFLTEGKPDSVWFDMEWDTTQVAPMHLQKLSPRLLRLIKKVVVSGPCQFAVSGLRLRRAKIGSTHVAWGKTVMFGRDAMLVATRDAAGAEKISMNLSEATVANVLPHGAGADGLPESSQDAYKHLPAGHGGR